MFLILLLSLQNISSPCANPEPELSNIESKDKNSKLVYRGQLDSSRPGNDIPVTGNDLRHAIENVINEKPVDEVQKPSIGCNIKWK